MVSVEDIATELGRPIPAPASAEFKQWSKWIETARLLIKARLGDLALLDQDVLDHVVTQAVALKVKRPDPIKQSQNTVSVDDGSVTRSATYDNADGQMSILDAWWDLLSPAQNTGGAFSISPYGSPGYATSGPCRTDDWGRRA